MQKKILVAVVALCLAVCLGVIAFSMVFYLNYTKDSRTGMEDAMYTECIVRDDDTPMFKKDNENSEIISRYSKGTIMRMIDYADNGFCKVIIDNKTGYIRGTQLEEKKADSGSANNSSQNSQTQSADAEINNGTKLYIINTDSTVELKSGAKADAASLANVPLGGQVIATGKSEGEFTPVSYNGTEGYIHTNNLTTYEVIAQNQLSERQQPAPPVPPVQPGYSASEYMTSKTTVEYTMYVANVQNSIYLRSMPAENSTNITTIPLGTAVGFIADCGNGFYKISYNGSYGYAKAMYLSSSRPHTASRQSGKRYMTVTGVEHSIYLRTSPSNDAGHYCEIPVGATVEYLGDMGNGYYKISYGGTVGYGTAAYLR